MKILKSHIAINFGLALFLGCQPIVLFGQQDAKAHIDSVLTIVKKQNIKTQDQTYEDLGIFILRKYKPDDATPLYQYSLQKDSTDRAKLWLYDSYSKNLSRRGYLDEAIALKEQGIALAEKLEAERVYIFYHISLANSYLSKNKPDKALQLLNLVEPIAEKDVNRDLLSNIYYNKGIAYSNLNELDKAESFYLKMYEVVKNYENNPRKRFAIYVLVDFYAQIDKPLQLTKFTELLSQLYLDAHPDMPAGHMPIKQIFANKLDPENIPRYQKAIWVSDSLKSYNSFLHTTAALTNVYNYMGQPQKAIPYLKHAETVFKSINKPSQLLDVYTLLTTTEANAKNFEEAYNYKLLQASMQDSLTSEKMQQNIAELEIKFETEKKERELVEQKIDLDNKTRESNQSRYALIALGILSLILLVFFRYRLKSQKTIASQTEALQLQKITDLQQKNKLLAMSSMIEGQEAERLRIAKDLHDSLGGLLSTVKAHFTTIQNEIIQLEKFNLTEKTNVLIDEACAEVRRISHNMMPQALSISGLKGAIEDLGDQLQEQGYITTVELTNLPEKIDPTREVMIYRLLQEILSNIRKHSNAKTILLQLLGHQNEINIIVEDDGEGFDYSEEIKKGGLGLKSINSRVQYLDGTINWDTKLDKGTTINITIPADVS